jgi:hypothetical protein
VTDIVDGDDPKQKMLLVISEISNLRKLLKRFTQNVRCRKDRGAAKNQNCGKDNITSVCKNYTEDIKIEKEDLYYSHWIVKTLSSKRFL